MTGTLEMVGQRIESPPSPELIKDDQYNLDVYLAHVANIDMDILVPAHGHIDHTMRCVDTLYKHTQKPFHLIVLDDDPIEDLGMTGKFIKDLQKKFNNITYIHSGIHWKCGNTFFNAGIKYSKTDIIVSCMNSVMVEPAWEIVALNLIRSDPQIGTIGFKSLFPNGFIESAGIAMVGHLPVDMGRDEPGHRCNEIRDAQAVQWAFAMHRKQAIEGNLDEDIFNGHVGWDDIDNNFVVKNKGWKILYCGQGVYIHHPRATRGSNTMEAMRLNQENAHTFFRRWGLWDKYIGGHQMDVRDVIKYESKDALTQAVTKLQVLQGLLQQSQVEVQALVNKTLSEIGVNPEQYLLEMNPSKNIWILKPNPNATNPPQEILPGHELVKPEVVIPAGDTQEKEGVRV